MLIDSHCHIDVEAFDSDRNEIIARCKAIGIEKMLVPAIKADSWDHMLSVCNQHPGLNPALGLHPVFQDEHQPSDVQLLEQYIEKYKPVAIGEIGLDFYIESADHDKQQYYLNAQFELAKRYDLPVILHVRKAHDQMLATLKKFQLKGGICHAFNGSMQQAEKYIDLGFKLGFGGMITYEGSNKLRRLAHDLPLEAIVLETDAPDMTGYLHQGERNSPEYLPEALATLAEIRDTGMSVIAQQSTDNVLSVFNLN